MQINMLSNATIKNKLYRNRFSLASGRALIKLLSEVYEPASRNFIKATLQEKELTGLHLGCGSGEGTFMLAEVIGNNSTITGIEELDSLIGEARAKKIEIGYDSITFNQMAISDWQAMDQYDFIFTRFLPGLESDDEDLSKRIYCGLKKGGLAIMQYIDPTNFSSYPYNHAFARSVELINALNQKFYPPGVEAGNLFDIVSQNGFKNVRINHSPSFFVTGSQRAILSLSLETVSTEIEQFGFSTPAELDALLIELKHFEKRKNSMISIPGIYQVLAEKQ